MPSGMEKGDDGRWHNPNCHHKVAKKPGESTCRCFCVCQQPTHGVQVVVTDKMPEGPVYTYDQTKAEDAHALGQGISDLKQQLADSAKDISDLGFENGVLKDALLGLKDKLKGMWEEAALEVQCWDSRVTGKCADEGPCNGCMQAARFRGRAAV